MPYIYNVLTSSFDLVDKGGGGGSDVMHLTPLTDGFVVVGAGTDFVRVTLAQIDVNGRLTLPEGNISGLIFGDGDSGIWERTDDNLRFVTAGVERITLDSTFFRTLTDGFSLKLTLGTETSPTYRFQDDQNTGIYQSAEDHLDFTTGGLRAGYFDSLQFFNLINPLGETSGGTGLNTYNEGDLLFASAIDTLSKLAIGAGGEVLTSVSGIPSWQPAPASGVQSVTGTANRIDISGTAEDPIIDISATYAGQNTITTLGTVTTGTWQGTPIDELFGGTGFTTYAEGDLLYSSSANTLAKLAIGSEGDVLTTVSGVPSWQPAAGGGGGDDKVYYFKATDFDALETNFAPLVQDNGTTAKVMVRAFDQTTEEYVNFSLTVPSEIDTGGTVTFRVWMYASTAVASRFVALTFGHRAIDNSESWDGAYTDEDSGDIAIDATQDDITEATWTETVSNLGWAANDIVLCRLSRYAPSGTNLASDLYVLGFAVEIPRA